MKYTNLNDLVQEYKVSKKGGLMELIKLKHSLSHVPVCMDKFREYLKKKFNSDYNELSTEAKFESPGQDMYNLKGMTIKKEAEKIEANLTSDYPVIIINGNAISKNFYDDAKKWLSRLILPANEKDRSVTVLRASTSGVVGVVYYRGKKMHYLEMILTYMNFR